jgi:hypothetical protein
MWKVYSRKEGDLLMGRDAERKADRCEIMLRLCSYAAMHIVYASELGVVW